MVVFPPLGIVIFGGIKDQEDKKNKIKRVKSYLATHHPGHDGGNDPVFESRYFVAVPEVQHGMLREAARR
jgi:hypothetical protein